MAWWGYGGNVNEAPNFDTAKVRLAHLSIIPSGQGFSFPQSYDQPGAECDFVDLYSKGTAPTPPGPPTPSPTPSGSAAGHQNLLWLWILLGVLGAIGIGVLLFIYFKKSKRKNRR